MWCGSLYRQRRNLRVRLSRYMQFPYNPPKTVLWFEFFLPPKKTPAPRPSSGYNKIKEPVNTGFVNTSFKSTLTKSGCPEIRADRPNLFPLFIISSCQNCDITLGTEELRVVGYMDEKSVRQQFHPRGDMWLVHNWSKPFISPFFFFNVFFLK